MTKEPVKIAIIMDGGLVQEVLSAGVRVEYIIVNYGTVGADEIGLIDVPQLNSAPVEAYVTKGDAETGYGPHVINLHEVADRVAARS